MTGKYTKSDLEHGGDSSSEHERLRAIFDDLIGRGNAGTGLSRIEQDFVFHGIEYFNENENNYPFVNDARFASNYLTYGFDLSGGSQYQRARGGEIIEVPPLERDNDLAYLKIEAQRYLRAGANYSFGKKYWEQTDPADCSFSFCGETIEFTELSLIHILNRHFAELGKPYNSGKDYHTEEIIPWVLASQVKNVMTQIDKAGLFLRQSNTLVNLRYKGEIYQFWAQEQKRSVKGRGLVTYKRVQTFYPVSKQTILADLRSNYREVTINGDLSVFVP